MRKNRVAKSPGRRSGPKSLSLTEWKLEAEDLLGQVPDMLQYPAGKNALNPPATATELRWLEGRFAGFGGETFLAFYAASNGLTWSDVHNGFWLDRISDLRKRGRHPSAITGDFEGPIRVFGTDGGGGMYAFLENRRIYHLPPAMILRGVYEADARNVEVVAGNFEFFLRRLRGDLDAFVRCDRSWTFMC